MKLTKGEIIGIVAALIPFFIFIGGTSISTENGQVVKSSYFNLIGVIGGIVAVIVAFGVIKLFDEEAPEKFIHIAVFVCLLLLGGFQLLHGIGMIA